MHSIQTQLKHYCGMFSVNDQTKLINITSGNDNDKQTHMQISTGE